MIFFILLQPDFFIIMTVIYTFHIISLSALLLSGIFIVSVRGNARPMIYMSLYRFIIAFITIVNVFQTYGTPYYGQLLWNPLHLLGSLIAYPLLFAYMFDLMRPGSVGRSYWLKAFVPLAVLVLLHYMFVIFRGGLPFFTNYAQVGGYLGEPELWVRFSAAGLFAAQMVIYTALTVEMLRSHTRNLKSNFSYTDKGNTLKWLWWNIGLTLLKGVAVLLMMSVEGYAVAMFCVSIFVIEPVITTVWVLRQKDLYSQPDEKEGDSEKNFEKKVNCGFDLSQGKRTSLKKDLLELLEKDEIFKDPELSIDKVREMLGTNRTYLSKVINQDMDTSFYQLINTYRVKKVVEMMRDSLYRNMPLKSIAGICGFKSLSAFGTFFKQSYGKTPAEWRADSEVG